MHALLELFSARRDVRSIRHPSLRILQTLPVSSSYYFHFHFRSRRTKKFIYYTSFYKTAAFLTREIRIESEWNSYPIMHRAQHVSHLSNYRSSKRRTTNRKEESLAWTFHPLNAGPRNNNAREITSNPRALPTLPCDSRPRWSAARESQENVRTVSPWLGMQHQEAHSRKTRLLFTVAESQCGRRGKVSIKIGPRARLRSGANKFPQLLYPITFLLSTRAFPSWKSTARDRSRGPPRAAEK